MREAVIVKGVGGLYTVRKDGKPYVCRARGIFRKEALTPVIGDYVEISEIDEEKMEAVIDEVFERRNKLVRPSVANVDQLAIVIAPIFPKPDFLLIDRLIITALYKGITPILVINKSDQDRLACDEIRKEYKHALQSIVITCAITGEGIEELKSLLEDKITVMCGQSGVGKSTILNSILETQVMETGDISDKTKRGKHTTRHSEMFSLKEMDGYVIDSPGFSMYELGEIAPIELQKYYPELDGKTFCKFQDCSHTKELGCMVDELIENGLFPEGRYDRYKYIYEELKEKELNKYK
ncbi:MAG TPA: ribosome small subunit-dependent GTPase A [Clostridiaceae bacterium]|jgi:ribosome biogenesis GTPase|nr:ribosome small subunit-dependent GTPase A [Clostridiaceae bacterium]